MKRILSFFVLLWIPLIFISTAHADIWSENFESYVQAFLVDNIPGWDSASTYSSFGYQGWMVDHTDTNSYIHFHPSPWPETLTPHGYGYNFNSNYATYHVNTSAGYLQDLSLYMDYGINYRGDMKVYLSADNSNWQEITNVLNLRKRNSSTQRYEGDALYTNTQADLTSYVNTLKIKNNAYVMFREEASSGSAQFSELYNIRVEGAVGNVPPPVTTNNITKPKDASTWLEIKHKSSDGKVTFAPLSDYPNDFKKDQPTLVLIHGWYPDNRNDDGTLTEEQNRLPGWVRETVNHITSLKAPDTGDAQLLGKRDDINVLALNWTNVASTTYGIGSPKQVDPKTNLPWPGQNCVGQGTKLASQLKEIVGNDYDKEIHLIGHSLGAGVATVAAFQLEKSGIDVDQVTLFDAPEGTWPCPEHAKLNLDVGIESNDTSGVWTDNYPTSFGKEYASAANFLTITTPTDVGLYHGYPMSWYFGVNHEWFKGDEEGTLNFSTGLPLENLEVGAYWSKVLNPSETVFFDSIRDELDSAGTYFVNVPLVPGDPIHPYTLVPKDLSFSKNKQYVARTDLGLFERDYWLKQGAVYYDDGKCEFALVTASPVYLYREVEFPSDSAFLAFDFKFENPALSDELTFCIGENSYFRFTGDEYPADWNEFINSGQIDVSEFVGTTQWISFIFDSELTGQTLSVKNIKLYSVTPEPISSALFLLGAGALVGVRRLRKKII